MNRFLPTTAYKTLAEMEENTIKEYFMAFPSMTMNEIGRLLGITARSLYTKCKHYNINKYDIRLCSSSTGDNSMPCNTL